MYALYIYHAQKIAGTYPHSGTLCIGKFIYNNKLIIKTVSNDWQNDSFTIK